MHGIIEFPGKGTLPTKPREGVDTLDLIIQDAKTLDGIANYAVLRNARDELIEARLEGDDVCWLRSDTVNVAELMGGT